MFLDRRALGLCFLFLAVLPVGLAEASKLKTEISPEVLDLKVTLDVRSVDAFEELQKENGFDERGVEVAKSESWEQSVNGYWSGPPGRSASVLTRTGSGGRWQVIDTELSGTQSDDSSEPTEFQTKEIDEFAYLEDFEPVEAFQE